jgi:hypothetical protein
MDPISSDLINAIPDEIVAEKTDCQLAADTCLMVLFTMADELEPAPEMPLIISNGDELYPLPAPWTYAPPLRLGGTKIDTKEVLRNVNEWLPHIKKNTHAYNEALAVNDIPTAERIAQQGINDSALIWNMCNALAQSIETEKGYRALELSTETKESYYSVAGFRS